MQTFFRSLLCACLLALSPTLAAAGYTQTRYPIVLVHGLFGFDRVGLNDYFYGVAADLRSGGAQVYTPTLSAANDNEIRGQQLLLQVQRILAATGAAKVNLIGHSQGVTTARYVASVRPNLVASVTSVGGANKGSKVADVVIGAVPGADFRVADAYASFISLLSGGAGLPQDAHAAAVSLSSAGAADFNRRHPEGVPVSACGEGDYQVRGVYYFSWSGAQPLTNALDPSDAMLALMSLAFGGEANDGLVSSCSSHLGRVIRDDYLLNHLDEINQVAGVTSPLAVGPLALYRQHANRLQGLGL